MQIVNFGSIDIDHVYSVDYFGHSSETINCIHYDYFSGGKGLNQSMPSLMPVWMYITPVKSGRIASGLKSDSSAVVYTPVC